MARAGIRFLVKEHTISLGGSFSKGGGDLKANVIGVSLLYSF
jgi:ribulose 1,5-bisphosphate synthetase/thiazole synthase